jgi:AcrR family transcriptional regulator
LNRARIAATAIRIADESGIGAVSLRGISSQLGVHVTSLYNHVPTKDAVLDEMVRALIAEAELPTGTLTWQHCVRGFADAMRALGKKHPGAFEAFYLSSAQGARAAETFETAFTAFRAAGFDLVASYSAVKATVVAVTGLVLDDTGRARKPGAQTDLGELPIESFPLIHEISAISGTTDAFDYLVDALIAGFEANLRRELKALQREDHSI